DNRKLKEWRGRAQIRLESQDFKATSQLIAELQQHFQTQSINFKVSDEKRKKVESELMIEATKNFQQRAQALTQTWNKPSYQLVNLNLNTNNYSPQPVPRMAMMKSASADMAVPEQEVAAGESLMAVSTHGAIQFQFDLIILFRLLRTSLLSGFLSCAYSSKSAATNSYNLS